MDLWAIIFSLGLALAGIWVIFQLMSTPASKPEPDDWERTRRQQAVRDARRIEQRRSRIWWKMDNMHAELMQRTSLEQAPPALSPEPSSAIEGSTEQDEIRDEGAKNPDSA
jgi:hypothetical protein